jgi:hypothetical protein
MLAYLAITSTYRPLLRPFFAPAFLGPPPAPKRSSMLLALLRLVAGRLGGLKGASLPLLCVLACLIIIGGPPLPPGGAKLSALWLETKLLLLRDTGGPIGGAAIDPMGGALPGGPPGGGGVPLPLREAARGGGGVADLAGVSSAPAFLLTHRLSSGSKTKLLASPRLARTAFGASPGIGFSFAGLLPLNQPAENQPFFCALAASARLAALSVSHECGDNYDAGTGRAKTNRLLPPPCGTFPHSPYPCQTWTSREPA